MRNPFEPEDMICYSCGSEFQGLEEDACLQCGSYDIESLEDAWEDAGLI